MSKLAFPQLERHLLAAALAAVGLLDPCKVDGVVVTCLPTFFLGYTAR